MLGRDKILDILKKLVRDARKKGVFQAEALYAGNYNSSARYANSIIIQNVRDSDRQIYFRVLMGKKVGMASTNSLHIEDLRRCLSKAIAIANQSRPLDFFDCLPEPDKYPEIITHFSETADFTIFEKTKTIHGIFTKATNNIKVGGAFSTMESEIGIVNSNGLSAYQPFTSSHINLITSSAFASGFASQFERNTKNIDAEKLLASAMGKTIVKQKARKLKSGKYTVILEAHAVNDILEWLVYIGFGARSFIDGTSFMQGNIGKKIMDKKISIYDDGNGPSGFPIPFDFEGVRKRPLDIIENGTAKGIAYDTFLANKCGRKTTGHALIPEDIEGPFPTNVFIKEGDYTLDEMIALVERGIIVTRFHYVNGLLDTKTALMTGMTRDGTFYIENGRIKYPIEDMRFTQSILEAFSRIGAISKNRQSFQTSWNTVGANIVPALLIKDFYFSD